MNEIPGPLSVGFPVSQLAVIEGKRQNFAVEARPGTMIFPAHLDACRGLLYKILGFEEKYANPLTTGKHLSHRNRSQLRAAN